MSQWLLLICALIFLMVVIGGVTRLTGSGLSITDWKPITGAIPPLSADAWQLEFDKYRASPQYQKINRGMALSEFKFIYFWEYFHRLWGRLIGLAFALPLVWFVVICRIPRRETRTLCILLALGGLQGVVGWLMVKSGLIDAPYVSHTRLAIHLSLALLIFCLCWWHMLRLRREANPATPQPMIPEASKPRLRLVLHSFIVLLVITIAWGAFTAGLKAGYIYNSFPLMNGQWLPPEWLTMPVWWQDITSNPPSVQFLHRWLAITTLLSAVLIALWWQRTLAYAPLRRWGWLLVTTLAIQAIIGIKTLLYQVPLVLGTLHQANIVIVLAVLTTIVFLTRTPTKSTA